MPETASVSTLGIPVSAPPNAVADKTGASPLTAPLLLVDQRPTEPPNVTELLLKRPLKHP